jgi:probable HAF family extracellular repeat protein
MTDLGTLGGASSYGYGINASGQVTGYANLAGNAAQHAFLTSGSTMTDLGTLGGGLSRGAAVNASGQVAGTSNGQTAFIYDGAGMFGLGTLGGIDSFGLGINATGQVTGVSLTASNIEHAFIYRNGAMVDLGEGTGYAINDAGQVAGGTYHAVLYSNGGRYDLGTLGGLYSGAYAINSAGQMTGFADVLDNSFPHAFLYSNGVMRDVNTFSGVAGSGWALRFGQGINNAGQLTGYGINAAGQTRAFLLTLDTTVWESSASGSWDSPLGWSAGIAPNRNTVASIDPTRSLTVIGPAANVDVKRLTIGGDASGNTGIATFSLNGGTITVLGSSGGFTTITARGVLTGDGTINGAVVNLGRVDAVNLTLTGGLANQGLVSGNGRLNTDLSNFSSATVRVDSGQRLQLFGNAHVNNGTIDLSGGEIQVTGPLTNNAVGRVLINSGRLMVNSSLSNGGQVLVSFGTSSVFGAITNVSGGKIILSGNSNTTFYDALDVKSGAELRVSNGSTGVFFGPVQQRSGALFTGSGTKFYEGGLSVGGSPGLGTDGGDVNFGAGNLYLGEIGGITACTDACDSNDALRNSSYDKYVVAGRLTFGGTLKLLSWQGFSGRVGQSFDLFDWGSSSGSFDAIDASGLALADGTVLDTSRLYVDGTVSVQAVPEPQMFALLLAGLAAVGVVARRRSPAYRIV